MRQGKFITLEGPEGGGKSTQIRRLARRLRQHGIRVLCTREPGGTPTGEAIRGILQYDVSGEKIAPEAELLLFEASRAQLVRHVILPALERGVWVLCDRFADSTTAYQGYGRGLPVRTILQLNGIAVGPAVPDLTVLLDVAVRDGFARLEKRRGVVPGKDRIEREATAFHQRVRNGFLRLARRWPDRFGVVDAGRPVAVVEQSIWKVVRSVLGRSMRECAG